MFTIWLFCSFRLIPVCRYKLVNRIPYARGLGSSSAAIVGGLIAGLVLAGHQVRLWASWVHSMDCNFSILADLSSPDRQVPAWGSEELLNMAAEIEGHPDNVAPGNFFSFYR